MPTFKRRPACLVHIVTGYVNTRRTYKDSKIIKVKYWGMLYLHRQWKFCFFVSGSKIEGAASTAGPVLTQNDTKWFDEYVLRHIKRIAIRLPTSSWSFAFFLHEIPSVNTFSWKLISN